MNAAKRKAGAGTPASHSNITTNDCRIPNKGFIVLHHLLYAAKNLHQLPALPDDAIQGVEILMTRIAADIARLGGAR